MSSTSNKTSILVSLLVIAATLLLSNRHAKANSDVFSRIETTCKSNFGWKYCIHKTIGSKNPNVVVYFHGIFENEQAWQKKSYAREIHQIWEQQKKDAPTIIVVSFGRIWFLLEKGWGLMSGLYERFIHEVHPILLSQVQNPRGKIILHGESMGGFNAIQILMKAPQLFSKVSLACPIIPTVNNFSSLRNIQSYVERTHAQKWRIYGSIILSPLFFPSPASWERASPLSLVANHVNALTPQTFISWSNQDEYGVFEGAKEFLKKFKEQKSNFIEGLEVNGPHCTVDPGRLAHFLNP